MTETTTLMTIGEFSSLSRLSVRMLRHYDSHGVLVPTTVDHRTGYRVWSVDHTGERQIPEPLFDYLELW